MTRISFSEDVVTQWYCQDCGFIYTLNMVVDYLTNKALDRFNCIDCGNEIVVPEALPKRAKGKS